MRAVKLNLSFTPGGGPFKTQLSSIANAQCQCWYCSLCAYTELTVSTAADIWQNFFLGTEMKERNLFFNGLSEKQLFKQQKNLAQLSRLGNSKQKHVRQKGPVSSNQQHVALMRFSGIPGLWVSGISCLAKNNTTTYSLMDPLFKKGVWHQIFDLAVKN